MLKSPEIFLFKTYFISPNGKWHSCIKVFSSIKHWFAIPKNLGFKVLNHMLHYFSENAKKIKLIQLFTLNLK